MDIKNIYEGALPYSNKKVGEGGEAGGSKKTGKATGRRDAASSSDKISLSDEGKLYSQAVRDAQSEPEIRANRVAELKAKVQSGEYQPDSKVIAEKLLLSEIDFL